MSSRMYIDGYRPRTSQPTQTTPSDYEIQRLLQEQEQLYAGEEWKKEYVTPYVEGEPQAVYQARQAAYQEMQAAEAAARAEYQEQLITQMAAPVDVGRTEFEAQLAARRAAAQKAYARKELAETTKVRREYAIAQRTQLSPAMMKELYGGKLLAARSVFEEELAGWETEQRELFTQDTAAWKAQMLGEYAKTSQQEFEQELTTWRTAGKSQIEQELSKSKLPEGLEAQIGGVYVSAPAQPVLSLSEQLMKAGVPSVLAGFVAAEESLIYGVADILGLWTPQAPPTVIGAIFSEEERARLAQYDIGYTIGGVGGEIFLSYLTGKAVSAVAKPIVSRVAPVLKPVTAPVGRAVSKITAPITKGVSRITSPVSSYVYRKVTVPYYYGSRPERFVRWYSGAGSVTFAPQALVEPQLPSGVVPTDLLRRWEAPSEFVWDLARTPETALVSRDVFQAGIRSGLSPAAAAGLTLKKEVITTIGMKGGEPFFKAVGKSVKSLKDSVSASATILARPRTAAIKPVLEILPQTISRAVSAPVSPQQLGLGFAAITGIRLKPEAPQRERKIPAYLSISRTALKPQVSAILKPQVKVKAVEIQKTRQISELRAVLATPSLLRTITAAPPPKPRKVKLKPRKRKKKEKKPYLLDQLELKYPVRGVKSTAKYILGKE